MHRSDDTDMEDTRSEEEIETARRDGAEVRPTSFLDLYRKCGLSFFPIVPQGKVPVIKEWKPYQTRKPTIEEVAEWEERYWKAEPAANVAVVCGQISGGLVVLDFDSLEGYREFAKHHPDVVLKTMVVKTGGRGYHVYLRTKRPVRTQRMAGIDVQAEGSYVIAPPSIHSSGQMYVLANSEVEEILEVSSIEELLPVRRVTTEWKVDWVTEALEGVAEGERDKTCIRLAGHFKARNLSQAETLALLQQWGKQCRPPFPGKDVEKCVRSAYSYTQSKAAEPSADVTLEWDRHYHRLDQEVPEEQMAEAIVDGVMWRGDVVELYGLPGCGKTSLLTSGVADLITGRDFWDDWKVNKRCRVLYLDFENPAGETRKAIVAAASGDEEAVKTRCYVAELTGLGFDIMRPEAQRWLEEKMSRDGFDVVVADNLSKMTGKNIIDDFEMKQVVNIIRSLTIRHNIVFFLVHHTGWLKYDNQGRPLPTHGKGGSSLMEDVNFCLEVVRVRKDTTRVTVKKIRSRRAAIAAGDEFLHDYEHETMRIVGGKMRTAALQARWLIQKYGLEAAAEKVGCSRQALGNYAHGLRHPSGDYKMRLEQVARGAGWIPYLGDL